MSHLFQLLAGFIVTLGLSARRLSQLVLLSPCRSMQIEVSGKNCAYPDRCGVLGLILLIAFCGLYWQASKCFQLRGYNDILIRLSLLFPASRHEI